MIRGNRNYKKILENGRKAELIQAYRKWTLNCRRRKSLMHQIKQIEQEERNESMKDYDKENKNDEYYLASLPS